MNKLLKRTGRLHSVIDYLRNKRRVIVFAIGITLGLIEAILVDMLLTFLHLYNTLFVLMLAFQGFGFGYLNAGALFKWKGWL